MTKTKAGRILCRTGIALSLVLCFAVAAAALVFPLAFSGAYPNLAVTLTETFSVSRGTQFLIRSFRSHFQRVFKKETQMTPGQYRAKSRK